MVDAPGHSLLAVESLTYEVCSGTAATQALLHDVSFTVAAASIFTVLGPSGSGKSTLLRCLNRLAEPTAGRVLLEGMPTAELPIQELRRRVGMVFQAAALFDGTVMDNILFGPRLRASGPRLAAAERDQATDLLRRVGLPPALYDQPADQLSGGEAQRVSLARALANDPDVLLLDEPTASLDPAASRHIEDLLLRLATETSLTLVFVTHDVAQARRIGDHGLLLVDGQVADEGRLPDFLERPGREITRRFVEGRLRTDAEVERLAEEAAWPATERAADHQAEVDRREAG